MKKIALTLIVFFLFTPFASAEMEIGAVFGAPAFLNAAAGYRFDPWVIRISGMYFEEKMNGVQLNVMRKYEDDSKVTRSLGIAVASSQDRGCDWSYLGPVYDYTNGAFFLELGIVTPIAVRRGDFSNITIFPIFQIGYIYQI